MLAPQRRHTRDCAKYGKWKTDCPAKKAVKCPFIIVRYRKGPSGRMVPYETALGTNDEKTAWELINKMTVSGESQPAKPPAKPKTVKECIDGFVDMEAKRGVQESTLKSFRKFLCGNPKRNPKGNYSLTLLEFAAAHELRYLSDFTPEHVTDFQGEMRVQRHALIVQAERLKQFFKFCFEMEWIIKNPAAKVKPPKVEEEPVYAFRQEDRENLLNAVKDNPYLLTVNLVLEHSALAPVDLIFLRPENLHGDHIATTRKKTGARVKVKLPPVVVERLKALPVQAGGYWFWNRVEATSKHETATGNLRRMMRSYFKAAKVYKRDEHGQVVLQPDKKTGKAKPVQGTLYQWRHTFVHKHIMQDTSPLRIAELIGDSLKEVMNTYAHFIEERQAQLDTAAETTWTDMDKYRLVS